MSKVAVVTDSCASIPSKLIQSLNIQSIPYYIHRGQEVLRDLVTIDADSFYRWLPTATVLPTTASPGPGDYLSKYRELAQQGVNEIISIHMTSKGSAAYQAAMAAKEMIVDSLPSLRIEIIDTLNVAMCHGWIAIEAAREAMKGVQLDAVVRRVKELIPITRMIQTADTLRYLQMGGRIGRATQLVGSLLNIKPLIGMEDGVIVALGKARSRQRAYRSMIEFVENAVGNHAIKIAYVHAAAMSEVEKLKEMIEARFTIVESLTAELSPALGVHSGPGTAGLCFYPVLP
ncbi:MAG: DegV family protein [Anaerolineales bacterium]|jgi:DegV family protein with EDD domain